MHNNQIDEDHPFSARSINNYFENLSEKKLGHLSKRSIIIGAVIMCLSIVTLVIFFKVEHLIMRFDENLIKNEDQLDSLYRETSGQKELFLNKLRSSVIKFENGEAEVKSTNDSLIANYLHILAKEEHYLKKVAFMKEMAKTHLTENSKEYVSYLLSLNNYRMVHQNIKLRRQIDALLKTEYDRLSKEHDFSLPELPFCLVVPTIDNGQDFRYEYNLQSIYNQNYTNYKVVIIDDGSNDNNFELIQNFIEENPIPQRIYLIKNEKRLSALPNIYRAATEFCAAEDILALVDGDDELLGVNVLKVFNSMYQKNGLDALYSNFVVSNRRDRKAVRGFSYPYSADDKKNNRYRDIGNWMFPIRSFKVSIFRKIPISEFVDDNGKFFISAYDEVICPQVLEMSCGRNMYIEEYPYLYNTGVGNNDVEIDATVNQRIMNIIRFKRKKHQCPTL